MSHNVHSQSVTFAPVSKVDFSNKRVWITGASSGIGASLARELSELGAFIILSARRKEQLESVQASLAHPERSVVLVMDLASSSDIKESVEFVKGQGELDLLIHNAGIAQKGLVIDNPLEIDRCIMETNYFGTIELTKEVLPIFMEQQKGWFAVVSSIAGIVGVPGRSAYAASKHALHGFFESLRAECYDCDLDISMIMPGFINTQITVKELKSDGTPYGKVERSHKQGMSPEECAKKIVKGLLKKKKNIIVGGFEVTSIYLQRFAPNLYDFLIKKHPMRFWMRFKSSFRSE